MEKIGRTKDLIFEKSVELFSSCGYENVSMRKIASEVGIKAASIYNHFSSKQEILECIFDYYEKLLSQAKPPFKLLKDLVRSGSPREIVRAFTSMMANWRNAGDRDRLVMINRLIYSRFYIDNNANQVLIRIERETVEYISEALNYGIEIQRFAPFDAETFARIFATMYLAMNLESALGNDKVLLPNLESENMVIDFLASYLIEDRAVLVNN